MWKKYVFEDGSIQIVKGMNRLELKVEIAKHGKLISITKA